MNPQQKNIAILITLTIMAFVVMSSFGYLIYISSNVSEKGNEVKVAGQLQTFQTLASTYYNRLGFYDGFCQDAGLPAQFVCEDGEAGVRVYTTIEQGYYCVDTNDFNGIVRTLPRAQVVCQ